ncbi:precorrin-4 C(11)-methyltransferase [Alkalibacter rhizosphaerae]|uniref:Precorrin-4 C(11)-methyltransferase n=1 Tax=Alkalibacter rhizosphaerae TaxID=2815577 RepID=A0A974XMW8_9FIRM|nr:precorrin-4 C(11)-methyltransferase [Alkalibacter rhizosphaerae]QSX08821.1 precorrin-4 C(11)-methyltransferase [Alkalibacter rhizosphaerae]
MEKQVYFIGAGPGDPDLITVKGKKIVESSDVIIYAGSLVNPDIIACAKKEAAIYNSASMTLEEVLEVMEKATASNLLVARVHTGDPSIYGAIREQMDALEKKGITYAVIPGVSSFTAAAAALKKEFTLPGVSQTVICTRLEGRTPVPEGEALEKLASHQASMAIFLSVQDMDNVVARLMTHYPGTTPVAIVEKASWPEERILLGTLEDIAEKVKTAGITKTAQILVGDFLGDEYELSLLYDKHFTHMFRDGIPK